MNLRKKGRRMKARFRKGRRTVLFILLFLLLFPFTAWQGEKELLCTKSTYGKNLLLRWIPLDEVSGYEIEYGKKSDFRDAKRLRIADGSRNAFIIQGKTLEKTFVRMRYYSNVNQKTSYAPWRIVETTVPMTAYQAQEWQTVSAQRNGIRLTWKPRRKASYVIFRRCKDTSTWEKVKDIKDVDVSAFEDQGALMGNSYQYLLLSCERKKVSNPIAYDLQTILKKGGPHREERIQSIDYPVMAPKNLKAVKANKKIKISWDAIPRSSGYCITSASNVLFINEKRTILHNPKKNSVQLPGNASVNYIRIAALDTHGKTSKWKSIEKKGRTHAPTKLSSGNITKGKKGVLKHRHSQGVATDGTYLYIAFAPSDGHPGRKSVIMKIRLKDYKVIQVSKPLNLGHANGMAYHPKTNRLIVTYSNGPNNRKTHGNYRFVVSIDCKSLSKRKKNKIYMPKNMCSRYRSFSSIAYLKKKHQFVLRCRGASRAVITDENFRVIESGEKIYRNINKPYVQGSLGYQSEDGSSYYIMSQYRKGSGRVNHVVIYNYNGKILQNMRIDHGDEIEGIYFYKNRLYGVFQKFGSGEVKVVEIL